MSITLHLLQPPRSGEFSGSPGTAWDNGCAVSPFAAFAAAGWADKRLAKVVRARQTR